ncbi:hypothetical protein SmJEL517_g04637 [Synchytrium microbalum]|uniref:Vasohibin n=1 Tax=Synchytrium microbalum TaxID=1806994 RepID=A0A507BXT6_9FUNG|nr:uncharacterized protein SmJEL517_g04637 [Synchytrium microbalum]TPX32242.1 hypothetical protein SmJEL517_g04637 [Synchytrium microbalum]
MTWIQSQQGVIPKCKPPNVHQFLRSRKEGNGCLVETIQRFLNKATTMEYNHMTSALTTVNKKLPFNRLMKDAQDILRRGILIKCLEAVVLSIYLTNPVPGMDRIPLGFVSEEGGQTRRHIILLIRYKSEWGALGLSRRDDLAGRAMKTFPDVVELIKDYHQAYINS